MKISKLKVVIYILVLVLIGVVYNLYKDSNLRTVTLNTKGATYTVHLSTDKDRVLATVSDKVTLKLRDGYYCIVVTDKKYESSDECFVVYKKDTSFILDLKYSEDYLKKELGSQQETINNVIATRYASIIGDYIICNGSLYGAGDIYGAAIRQKTVVRNDATDVYRVVLHKKDGIWGVVNYPVIVLDKYTFADIPIEILKKINTLPVCKQS